MLEEEVKAETDEYNPAERQTVEKAGYRTIFNTKEVRIVERQKQRKRIKSEKRQRERERQKGGGGGGGAQ